MREPIRATIRSVAIACFAMSASAAHAAYLFSEGDHRAVQRKLIQDMQAGAVDLGSFSDDGKSTIMRMSDGRGHFPLLDQAGALQQVCEATVVTYPKGSMLAFRSVHERGCVDWVMTTAFSPERIRNLVFLTRLLGADKTCGPPLVLPFLDASTKVLPPVQFDCLDKAASTRPATDDELSESCRRWPDMC